MINIKTLIDRNQQETIIILILNKILIEIQIQSFKKLMWSNKRQKKKKEINFQMRF